MENVAARMRQTGIENCWFLQRKAQFALQTVRMYVRDWKGERILKKMCENKRLRLVGGESRSPEKPGGRGG